MPYPWFDFVSPELLVSPGDAEVNVVCDRVAVKVGKLKFNVVQMVKNWWRRWGLVEVKPQVGVKGFDMLG